MEIKLIGSMHPSESDESGWGCHWADEHMSGPEVLLEQGNHAL